MKSISKSIFMLAVAALFLLALAASQSTIKAQDLNASVNIEQCANGPNNEDPTCGGSGNTGWVTGNVGASKANYRIGDFLPYRQTFEGLEIGNEYCFGFNWDVSKSGMPALDYISTFDLTRTLADPTVGFSFDVNSPTDTIAIPADPALTGTMSGNAFTGTQEPGVLTMWGGTFTGGSLLYSNDGSIDLATRFENSMEYCFTATSTDTIISWAAHIADPVEWGGLARPTGSPYHTSNGTKNSQFTAPRTSETDLSCETPGGTITHQNIGRSDLQLQAGAVEDLPRDWGDLPDPMYPTLLASNGPSHVIVTGDEGMVLGTFIDAEADGQPSIDALDDDVTGNPDDEDGIDRVGPWANGVNGGTVKITATGGATAGSDAWVCGWFDFGDFTGNTPDGTFDTFLKVQVPLDGSANNYSFDVPPGTYIDPLSAVQVNTYARFRLFVDEPTCDTSTGYEGDVSNGEVEDYNWRSQPTAISFSDMAAGMQTANILWIVTAAFILLAFATVAMFKRNRG